MKADHVMAWRYFQHVPKLSKGWYIWPKYSWNDTMHHSRYSTIAEWKHRNRQCASLSMQVDKQHMQTHWGRGKDGCTHLPVLILKMWQPTSKHRKFNAHRLKSGNTVKNMGLYPKHHYQQPWTKGPNRTQTHLALSAIAWCAPDMALALAASTSRLINVLPML